MMAIKREITSMTRELSGYRTDDSDDTVPLIKRIKEDVLDTFDSKDIEVTDFNGASTSMECVDEKHMPQDLFDLPEKPGPRCYFPRDTKPIEYFKLFFVAPLWALMVQETNRYAEELLESSEASQASRMKMWKPVTVLEMKAFVAVLLEMGITKRPTISSYWAENSRSIPWFQRMFSRNRFQLILKCFHLVDNKLCFPPGHENYDPCAKFSPLVDHANRVFKLYYRPRKELSVDQSPIGTVCHSTVMQYLPNKKHQRCGMKFWMLSDAFSKYCLRYYCYPGTQVKTADSETNKFDLGYNIVVNLLEGSGYLNKGYHIFVDNFFTSIALAKYLYSNGTYLTGTIKKNRKDIPNDLKKLNVNEFKYFRSEEMLLYGYREKKSTEKSVLLISTQASNEDTSMITNQDDKERCLTNIVECYNNLMGGVDQSDKSLYTYLDDRRALKHWKKVAFNILAEMVLNAYLIYKETVGNKVMSRYDFTSSIIFEIECEWMEENKKQLVNNEMKTFGLIKLPGRNLRQCSVCSNKNDGIKRSHLICVYCKKGVHSFCLDKHVCYKFG